MKGKNEVFVDQRHTPEVVVAISDLSWGFVGFSPISAIMSFLSRIPELSYVTPMVARRLPYQCFPLWRPHKAARAYEKALLGHLLIAAQDARACRTPLSRMHGMEAAALSNPGKVQNLDHAVRGILSAYSRCRSVFKKDCYCIRPRS